eukprot:TRINITY_DN7868_c0_g1_i2.p3 TRINITY_DN7868_c0_g1~~TRINITY_DN7868_c0_g1_i2.p3  ORF type:complete len:256 (+),score=14.21 TRINITY_DN7868_c0_g1_i2:86-769(+)
MGLNFNLFKLTMNQGVACNNHTIRRITEFQQLKHKLESQNTVNKQTQQKNIQENSRRDQQKCTLKSAKSHISGSMAYALKVCFRLLNKRDYSCQELKNKMISKEIDIRNANLAVNYLAEQGIINDEQYAKAWSASWKRKNRGPYYAQKHLFKKGICKQDIQSAMQDVFDEDRKDVVENLILEVRRKVDGKIDLTQNKQKAKLRNWLIQRGHTFQTIDDVFNALKQSE